MLHGPESSFSDRELDSGFPIGRIGAGHQGLFFCDNTPLDRVCLTQWPAYKSAHIPRSRAPISMLTADCGAEVLPASPAISAVVRVKSGSMSSGKNRERAANM